VPKIVGERGKGTEGLARALQYVDKIEQQTTGSRQKIADKREPAQESARKQTAAMSGQQTGDRVHPSRLKMLALRFCK
jgi:hypothetical protein